MTTVLCYVEEGRYVLTDKIETDELHLLSGTKVGVQLEIIERGTNKLGVTLCFENPALRHVGGDIITVRVELDEVLDLKWYEWKRLLNSFNCIDFLSFFTDYHPDAVDDQARYAEPIETFRTMLSHILAKHCKIRLEWEPFGKHGGGVEITLSVCDSVVTGSVAYHSVQKYMQRNENS
jgi:hypothetical protein